MKPRCFVPGLRWWIVSLVFLATTINFIDRLVIAVLAPVITERLGLTNLEFAGISTWFLLAYTASQAISGKLYDRLGTRLGFTLSVLLWSFAEMGHAFAGGLRSLSALRFLLGLGEAGNWPGATKVIAEWFPVRERALGMAIFNCGVAFGSIVAPPLIVWLQLHFGWQATFLATGLLGLGWLVLWRLFYQTPDHHPKLGPLERALILDGRGGNRPVRAVRWRDLLRLRQTWAIVLARLLTDPAWWLYITWLPLYLHNVRGFSLKEIGMFAWAPYVVAASGSLTGGWLCGHLIARGWSVGKARRAAVLVGAALMTAGIPAAHASSAAAALAFISVVMFGFQCWIASVQTLPSDLFPEHAIASVAGLGGVGAGIGAMAFTMATGFVVDHLHTYTPILVAGALLPLLGTGVLILLGGFGGACFSLPMPRLTRANPVA